jgi:hypothetical protein
MAPSPPRHHLSAPEHQDLLARTRGFLKGEPELDHRWPAEVTTNCPNGLEPAPITTRLNATSPAPDAISMGPAAPRLISALNHQALSAFRH